MSKQTVREFLKDIAENEIISGKEYSLRIPIDDGGYNSYIGLNVSIEDWKHKPKKVTREVQIFRHTNNVSDLINTWRFSLGGICHPYAENPDIPLEFSSYGKTPEEAEAEIPECLVGLRRMVREMTVEYMAEAAAEERKERKKLLARLAELEGRE